MKKLYLLLLLIVVFTSFGCKKIIHKHQLLDQGGKWIIKEQRIKITHYDGEVSMDTILYNSGYFEFRKYTRKEKRDYEKAGTILSNVVGNVVYSMWIPTTYFGNFVQNQNTNYELEKATLSGDWSSSHVPGFKPEFLLDRIEVKTTKIGNNKQEWVYNYGRRTVNTETIEHILIVERE